MNTVSQVMTELKEKGTESTRKIFERHGIDIPNLGVKVGDLKTIAKKIKGNQALALELYDTGVYDAMYLAGLVADGAEMSKKQLEHWAKSAKCDIISSYPVTWAATESAHARELALKWINSKTPSLALAGWSTYGGIVATTPDDELDLEEVKELLDRVVAQIDKAANKVRYVMNGFVISVGTYVKPLLKDAKKAAKSIGVLDIDMGDTACKVPVASEYIEKVEKLGRVGKKRASMKC
jgi:hypothetical protein